MFFSLKKPVLMIILYLIIHISVAFLNSMLTLPENLLAIGYGINLPDLLLIIMAFSVLFHLCINTTLIIKNKFFFTLSLLFLLYLIFEIGRNIHQHGTSALGEFRYRYMVLFLFYYVIVLIDDQKKMDSLLKGLFILSLFIPLFMFPIIGFFNGWHFGAQYRFFNANLSLGLLYGVTAWILAIKYNVFKGGFFTALLIISSLFLVLVDSHRSVWITLIAIIIVLAYFNEYNFIKIFKYSIPMLLICLTIYILITAVGLNVFEYLGERGGEIINPGTEGTGYWRISVWRAQLEKFHTSPLVGEGFGGYWLVFVPEFNRTIDISPHSLYVQTLVKLGIVGFLIYGSIILHCVNKLLKLYRIFKSHNHNYAYYLLISVLILTCSHVFYSVYAFEPYSLTFSGLGLSLAFRLNANYS